MKRITFILAAAFLFSSCKSYMMGTVSGPNIKADEYTGALHLKNDSLDLSYNFSGKEGASLKIELYNKLNEPLYVNWEKSAIIVGDKAYSFVDDKLKIEGSTSSTTDKRLIPGFNYTDGRINGTVQLSKTESFIPPKSKIARTSAILNQVKFSDVDNSVFHKTNLNLSDGSGVAMLKEAEFTEKNSPLIFRGYLTLYTLKDNQPKFFSIQQDFYVSKLTTTMVNPGNIAGFDNNPGNVIVAGKAAGYNKTEGAAELKGSAALSSSTGNN